mmetsp:Transcript_37358/g.119852  ORF Transcript_37358/g.119852 Transcript_37358/m.119852 type:complete len:137 (-) Transcript_37358:1934-2344(-)
MLRREDELRRSPEVQAEMERAEASGGAKSDWIDVAVRVQERVAEEFGFCPKSQGVDLLRKHAPDHPELCHYVRYNRARRGELRAGDAAPNVKVFHVAGSAVRGLFDDAPAQKPTAPASGPAARRKKKTLVLAGSYS